MSVLYITHDGVTDHIGRSQVAPYLLGLAGKGFQLRVVSAEKAGRDELVGRYQKLFDEAGISWIRRHYRNTPQFVGQAATLLELRRAARAIVRSQGVRVVHCRSFIPGIVGYEFKRTLGTKFIFDFRDFVADGGLVKSRGARKLISAGLKKIEGPMIREADKIVCLTHKASELLSSWYLRDDPRPDRRFQIVPCCADFSHFDRGRLSAADIESARAKLGVRGKPILLYLGSLGPDYLLAEMIALFLQLLKARPNSQFLFLCNNGKELIEAECAAGNIPPGQVLFRSADRDEVPSLIALADMSVIFIRADVSKVGCSPTKLAELFACGVPVIANSGVGDMDSIIALERNGSVIVRDFSDASLSGAINQILAFNDSKRINIRENSREFALEEGVARYATVYSELLAG